MGRGSPIIPYNANDLNTGFRAEKKTVQENGAGRVSFKLTSFLSEFLNNLSTYWSQKDIIYQ